MQYQLHDMIARSKQLVRDETRSETAGLDRKIVGRLVKSSPYRALLRGWAFCPKVYPAPNQPDCWVVEAPDRETMAEHVRLFTGSTAQRQAVQFAHETFGAARLFIR